MLRRILAGTFAAAYAAWLVWKHKPAEVTDQPAEPDQLPEAEPEPAPLQLFTGGHRVTLRNTPENYLAAVLYLNDGLTPHQHEIGRA